MIAKLISTDGPWLEAVLEIGGNRFTVMDEFSLDERTCPALGSEFDAELSALLDNGEDSWESMFSSNHEMRRCLVPLSGWRYQAFGRIVSISPVIVDCGLLQVPDVLHTNDPRVIGEFIAFGVSRLDASVGTRSSSSCS